MSTKKELRFDQVLLDSMEEPLSVRVEKIKGGNRMPIDLPPRDADMPSGVGWDKTSVRRLETWLVNDWSGGGLYHITVSDLTGRKMEWQALYDPRQFPEMIPHTMQANINQPATPRPAQAAPPPQQAAAAPSNGGLYSMWPPPGYLFTQSGPIAGPPPAPAPQPMPAQPTPMALPWTWAQPPSVMQQPTAPTPVQTPSARGSMLDDVPRRRFRFDEDESEKRQLENRTRELEEKVRQSEKERIEADYKAQLDRARLESERQVKEMQQAQASQAEALKEELRRMREAHQQQPVGNPEMDALKEERARIERDRENMLREQREAKERDEVNKRFEQLQTLIAKLAEQPKNVGPDPTLVAMQEQQKALQDELRRERERGENERREREKEERARLERETLREEIRRREEDSKRREDMLVLQINEIKANATKGPDPILQIMESNTRNQIDALKEMMRAQQMSNDRMQNLTMSPRDMISLLKENSSGLDDLKRGVVDVYKDVFEMQRMIVEQAAQLNNSGESPTMRLVETGLSRAGELADRYFKTKRDEVVSAAKVQEATIAAQAQNAQAYAIQQARLAQLAQQEAAMRNQAAAQATQAARSGLDGTAVAAVAKEVALASAKEASAAATPAAATPTKKKKATSSQIDDGTTDPATGKTIAKIIPLRRLGRTDEEWFGQAFDHVKSLRTAVDEFIKSLKATPPRVDPKTGKIIGASPEQCIEFLIRAVNYILAQNLEVAAVRDLFMEDRFAELLDIVIPDAPQGYRDDCVKILYLMAEEAAKEQAGPQVADVGEDEDDDDDDDDEEEGNFNDQNPEE